MRDALLPILLALLVLGVYWIASGINRLATHHEKFKSDDEVDEKTEGLYQYVNAIALSEPEAFTVADAATLVANARALIRRPE